MGDVSLHDDGQTEGRMVRYTDGQTDMMKLMAAFHNFVHKLKESRQCSTVVQNVLSRANLLTPWSRVLLEKLTGSAASQEIPRIFGTRKFITVLTSARHLSLS